MMNCEECRDELAAYLEGLLDETRRIPMESHLAECLNCQIELHEARKLTARLACAGKNASSVSLETAVIDRILQEQTIQLRRLKMRRRIRVLGFSGATAAAAAMLLISSFWLTQPVVAESEKAAKVLAQGAEAVPDPFTVHIVAKMRTPPDEYFESIDADGKLVPVEVWRQFGDQPRWRIEKPGFVTVMDDTSITTFQPPTNRAWRHRRPEGGNCDTYPILLLQMAEVRGLLDRELRTALANGWDLKRSEETTATGEKKLLVAVEAKSGWSDSNYAKNKSFDASDMRRVYRFDAATQRLEGLDAYLHRPGGDVLVLSIERIEYGQPINPARFVLTLPADVELVDYRKVVKEPERLPDNEQYEKMTPKEAAQAFFEACAKEDWDEVQKYDTTPLMENFKKAHGGLKIIRLGEPFQMKRSYYGWYIPYEIVLKDGTVKKWNLAMRNDNSAKRYVWDGGL